ncbi:hypothetical protein JHK85_033146 [Glycine max]|nr:hypothetical protein JHK85_033146 [Glycine max]
MGDVVKLMKVVWMSFPLGIFITVVVCLFVFWWQQISYSSPHGQAILINGQYPGKSKKLGNGVTESLKLVLLIGLVFMAFGPSYSYSLIRLLYGEKWSDGEASTALRCYCFYVIVLAMNGTSEAFMHAVATESQLKRSNDSLLVFSLIYIVLNVLLIRSAGAVGLIMANSLTIAGKNLSSEELFALMIMWTEDFCNITLRPHKGSPTAKAKVSNSSSLRVIDHMDLSSIS